MIQAKLRKKKELSAIFIHFYECGIQRCASAWNFCIFRLQICIFSLRIQESKSEPHRGSSGARFPGTVPNLVDLTTDEYSFVIKCLVSRHLPVRRKTPPPCRGGGSKSWRGFPPTCHSARGTKRPLWPPQGEQNGHYGRREGNKRALWPPHGEQKGRYAPVGVSPLRPFGARPPARRDSSFLPALTADIQKFVKAGTLRHPIASIHFSISVKSPKMRTVPSSGARLPGGVWKRGRPPRARCRQRGGFS